MYRIGVVLVLAKTARDNRSYFSIRWFSLNHEIVEVRIDCFEGRTIGRISLPTANHYLIVTIMTVAGLVRINQIIIQSSQINDHLLLAFDIHLARIAMLRYWTCQDRDSTRR